MWLDSLMRAVGPVIGMAISGGGNCRNGRFEFSGDKGVPLAELDLGGEVPGEVSLLGPDQVVICDGTAFAIACDGEPGVVAQLRFVRDGASLVILRERGGGRAGHATVTLTLPPPRKLTAAGSGEIVAEGLAADAEVVIAGSGHVEATRLSGGALELVIAGSGHFSAQGRLDSARLNLAGSGNADLRGVKVEQARVEIAGSGNARLSSDGEVDVRIMGSGMVTVRGSARCTVQSMGSGRLVCERDEDGAKAA